MTDDTTTRQALTVPMATYLSTLVAGVMRGARVRWINPATGDDVSGTLRHFTAEAGNGDYARFGQDVFDTFVRITTTTGWETWLSVPEILDMIRDLTFVIEPIEQTGDRK
jgi:hypothetical protein